MKKSILITLLSVSTTVFSQVGINTDAPKATLDVMGEPANASSLDGIIAPRLVGEELRAKTYTPDQKGALVYITVSDTAPSGQTIDVTSEGYYYSDGTKWVKLNNGAEGASAEPWYNAATNAPATANTQNIYQMGKVGVMLNNPTALHHIYNNDSSVNPFTVEADNADRFQGNDSYFYGYGTSMTPGLFFLSAKGTKANPLPMEHGNLMGEYNFGGYLSTGWNSTLVSVRGSYDGDGTTGDSSLDFLTDSIVKMKLAYNGNLGIGTTIPTERLDNSGITRLRMLPLNGATNAINTTSTGAVSAAQDQTFTATKTLVADDNGVVGTVSGLPQAVTPTTGSTIVKVIYSDTDADATKTVTIGDMIFRFDNASGTWSPQMALNSPMAKTVYVGMNQQYATNGFEYNNWTKTFTTGNATIFQNIATDSSNTIVNYELNIFHIVDVNANAYYRVTFYVSGPSSGNKAFVIVAEKF